MQMTTSFENIRLHKITLFQYNSIRIVETVEMDDTNSKFKGKKDVVNCSDIIMSTQFVKNSKLNFIKII